MTELTKSGKPRRDGMFKPGHSGNPSGRPKDSYRISDLAKEHTELALATLVAVMNDPKAPHNAKVQAAEAVLNRAWGKPIQAIQSHSVIATYQDFLRQTAEAEKRYQAVIAAETVSAQHTELEEWANLIGSSYGDTDENVSVDAETIPRSQETKWDR